MMNRFFAPFTIPNFNIFIEWRIILLCLTFNLSSCHSPNEHYQEATNFIQENLELGEDNNELKGILFIPLDGCETCVEIATDFLKENIDLHNTFFVLISETGKKQIHINFEDAILEKPNILMDYKFKSIKSGLANGYPVLYYMKDNKVIEKRELIGLDIDQELYELKRIANNLTREKTEDAVINYSVIEQKPQFESGIEDFYTYIQDDFKYPQQAKNAGIEGKVLTEFIIDNEGAIKNVKVIKGIGEVCDTAVTNVIKASPTWIPGRHKNEIVATRVLLPIALKIPEMSN